MIPVAWIEASGVFSYRGTERLELPSRGVVLISGANGQGKSSWIEATASAVWGETLRGTPPWHAEESGTIRLGTYDGLTVSRTCTKGGAKKLEWRVDGQPPTRWESTTKAQAALVDRVGPFEVWSRASVFSSQDADSFAAASDAPRKALLERLFGLDRFAPALARARKDRADADRAHAVRDGEICQLRTSLASSRTSLDEAHALLAVAAGEEVAIEAVDVQDLERKASALRSQVDSYRRRITESDHRRLSSRDARSRADADAKAEDARFALLAGGQCPTCAQPIPDVLLADLRARVESARQSAITLAADARRIADEVQAEVEELTDEQAQLRSRADTLAERARGERYRADDARRAAKERRDRRTRAEQVIGSLGARVQETERALAEMEGRFAEVVHEAAVLSAVERVLGLQGVRAAVLGRGLSGLAGVTNGIFRIAGWDGLRVNLRPYRTLADGKTTRDEIDLLVEGCGGGYGYPASSGGQRRRIDVGLVLGLAEIGAAAHGRHGTLWMDEVFDGLDSDGLDGIGRVLASLSRDRCLVVITHRTELADRLEPAAHYHVERHHVVRAA